MNRIICCLLLLVCSSTQTQTLTEFITVDQFGYRPDARKVAVIRDPVIGYDSEQSFTPGNSYAVIDEQSGNEVFSAAPQQWNSGEVDSSSGDRAWWFDFSEVTTDGNYYILDVDQDLKSHSFTISENVYDEVLKHALRTFFYQRAGFEKTAEYAGEGWADGASHLGPNQDANARDFFDQNNPETERDLRGGWYDAGDFNKYSAWTANYIISFLHSYQENPNVWGDNFGIPESGNGIPDIIDETMFGMDWLMRMQNEDGSVLSVLGLAGGSPPSQATDPSYYGPPNTIAARGTAAAFALGASVFRRAGLNQLEQYADTLEARAIDAWLWAEQYPDSIFNNNSEEDDYDSRGLAAGNQETDDMGRVAARLEAAVYLFELTGDTQYRDIFDQNHRELPLFAWSNFVDQYRFRQQSMMKYYSALDGATPSVAEDIRSALSTAYQKEGDYIGALNSQTDPYRAYINQYNWGSNAYKSTYGITFWQLNSHDFDPAGGSDYLEAAESYIHYIHGVNPLGIVYLTNMNEYGADNSVSQIYHTWFTDGSPEWDEAGVSEFGPPPGFLAGGPNDSYDWDGCCPSGCGSAENNALCLEESIEPPKNQPPQKSYKDFNTSWPLNSWSVTENSNGYQCDYIRLLSKFVSGGTVSTIAPSGQTALKPFVSAADINLTVARNQIIFNLPENILSKAPVTISIFSLSGKLLYSVEPENIVPGRNIIPVSSLNLSSGTVLVRLSTEGRNLFNQLIIAK